MISSEGLSGAAMSAGGHLNVGDINPCGGGLEPHYSGETEEEWTIAIVVP